MPDLAHSISHGERIGPRVWGIMETASTIRQAGESRANKFASALSELIDRIDLRLAMQTPWFIACLAVIALQMVLVFTHRPWLDEWQALQIALQSPTLTDLFENLRYEGHPPLWYLVLRGLGLFLPWQMVLPVAAGTIALITQALILFRSPFTRAERLLLATSELVMFEYLTLARSLTFGVLVLVLTVVLWRRRWVWLAIAVLPLCDFLFGVLSICFVLLKWRERGLWLPGVAAWIGLGLLSAYTVIPAPGTVTALWHEGIISDFASYVSRLGAILFPFQTTGLSPEWNGKAPFLIGAALCYLFIRLAWYQTEGFAWHRIVMFGFIGVTLVFSMAIYPLHFRHLSLAGLLVILLCWVQAYTGKPRHRWFRAWLVSMTLCGLAVAAINLTKPFDTADLAAKAIAERGLTEKHWVAFPDSRAQGVSALTGMEFERTEAACMQQFIRWNHRSKIASQAQLENYLRTILKERGQFYLLSDLPMHLPRDLARDVARIPPGYNGQGYYLFQIGPNESERSVTLPRCIPNIRPLEAARLL